jgi:hypothetical protein
MGQFGVPEGRQRNLCQGVEGGKEKEKEANVVAVRRGKKLTTVALDRVVDMMFPRLFSGTHISNLPSLDTGKANLFILMSGQLSPQYIIGVTYI